MKIAISSDNQIYELSSPKVISTDNELLVKAISELTPKEKRMKAKSLVLVNKKTKKILLELSLIHNQHFYPLSILDYANAMMKLMKKEISNLPIMSLDSHDYNFCDFNCKDCLAVDTREWSQRELDFNTFNIDDYEKVLKEIARYSKERGCDSVRFEMSGEGNPDMYKHRARIIKFAAEECNMKPVYISSGSRLDEETIDVLAKYAYYIRISLPGVNNKAYDIYSAQKIAEDKKFNYEKAIQLIETLIKKRKEYGREDKLMIGARTCMRPENEGSYIETAKKLGNMGVDSFQIVKILIPMGEKIDHYKLTENTIKEIEELQTNYKNYGLLHVQTPHDLDYMYYDREIEDTRKPSQCYSAFLSPILYGPHLVVCTHWEKIKDIADSHYGKMTGEVGQLEEMMCGENGQRIRKCVPEKCSSCCSIFDNQILEVLRSQLALESNLDNVEFLLTY
ncbi:MAG: radical SAM protein [Mollicutes bacterium]|nr:radical SAM protein [Mollicutes bacterium]